MPVVGSRGSLLERSRPSHGICIVVRRELASSMRVQHQGQLLDMLVVGFTKAGSEADRGTHSE